MNIQVKLNTLQWESKHFYPPPFCFVYKKTTSPLEKKSPYICTYTPSLLFPIPREKKRKEINVPNPIPFHGADIWNAFELSWLNSKGKPQVFIGTFCIPCTSEFIVESKSFKLYLNSLNQSHFSSNQEVKDLLKKDLENCVKTPIQIDFFSLKESEQFKITEFEGYCIDELDLQTNIYHVNPDLLQANNKNIVEERLYSNLLKSNCLVTKQADWASLFIHYRGPQICHYSLLKYIISFRNHNEFHEQCIERIFMDLLKQCDPEKLTVYGRYTRRGGLDINPFRSNFSLPPSNIRNPRQ